MYTVLRKKNVVIVILLALAGGGVYYSLIESPVSSNEFYVAPYDKARDRAFIFDEFKAHWSLLQMNATYDIDFMLEKKAPNTREPLYYGKMPTMMLCHDNKPVGFITYYMRTPYQGEILFLDIANEYQGKKLGEKLLTHAFADLKKQGAKIVKLFTRSTNFPAQKLYKRVGFVECEKVGDVGFYFRKEL